MTKREALQKRRDMEAAQRAFDRLRSYEKAAIADALHVEQIEEIAGRAHGEWLLLLGRIDEEREECAKGIEAWPDRLRRSPQFVYNELEWADSLFTAAARANVLYEAGLWLRLSGPEDAEQWLIDQLRYAAGPGTSSSTSHNLIRACRAEALGRVLEMLQWSL